MAILCAPPRHTVNGCLAVSISSSDCYGRFARPSMISRDTRVKIPPFAVLTWIAWVSACHAGERSYSPANGLLIHVDWQEPWFLPRRFRDHCSFDVTQARYYCSNHCGSDHEFYYCSKKSFGCCHIGVGYCDWDGLLRCHW